MSDSSIVSLTASLPFCCRVDGSILNHQTVRDEVVAWCRENLRHPYEWVIVVSQDGNHHAEFGDEIDRLNFKLRWVG